MIYDHPAQSTYRDTCRASIAKLTCVASPPTAPPGPTPPTSWRSLVSTVVLASHSLSTTPQAKSNAASANGRVGGCGISAAAPFPADVTAHKRRIARKQRRSFSSWSMLALVAFPVPLAHLTTAIPVAFSDGGGKVFTLCSSRRSVSARWSASCWRLLPKRTHLPGRPAPTTFDTVGIARKN